MNALTKKTEAPVRLLMAVFAVMLAFNFLTPLAADDYLYSFTLDSVEPVRGLGDIVRSLNMHWRYWNGRIAPHFLDMISLQLPKAVFNVVNSANAALLLWLLCRYVEGGGRRRTSALALTMAGLIWVLTPAFGQVFLWETGSFNYSWCLTATLAFIYPFYAWYMDRELRRSAARLALFCCLAFIAGGWSENGSLAALCAAFCLMAVGLLEKRRPPLELLLPFAFGCAGFFTLMLAPSELGSKGSGAGSGAVVKIAALLERLARPGLILAALAVAAAAAAALALLRKRAGRRPFFRICQGGVILCAVAAAVVLAPEAGGADAVGRIKLLLSDTKESLIIIFALYALLMLSAIERRACRRALAAAGALGLSAAASLAVFAFAPYFPARSAFVASAYTALADAVLLSTVWDDKAGTARRVLTGLFTAVFAACLVLGAAEIWSTFSQQRQRDERIASALAAGETELSLDPIRAGLKYSALWKNEALNFCPQMEAFYGADSIWIEGIDFS